jgi:nucleoside-diphosphate-sugar epimerase
MTNLTMARHLCEVLEKRRCAHVVLLSSDAVYAGHTTSLDERSSREPMDLYAVMHTAREMMLGSVLTTRHVPVCIFRPVNMYGFGDPHNSYGPNRFIRQAFDNRKISLFGQGEERRCHLYVEDAARLIGIAIVRRVSGTFNMAPPEAVTFLHIAETIRAACPFPVELEFTPRSTPTIDRLSAAARLLGALRGRPPRGPVVHRTYAVGKLQLTFPNFCFTPMHEAIRRYIRLVTEAHPMPATMSSVV